MASQYAAATSTHIQPHGIVAGCREIGSLIEVNDIKDKSAENKGECKAV